MRQSRNSLTSILKKHKGIVEAEASVLIILLGLFILVYVILLPPEAREGLIGTTETGEISAQEVLAQNLLTEYPGKVYPSTKTSQTYTLNPIHLYSKTETETVDLVSSLKISRNLLKNNFKTVYFNLKETESISDARLLFIITESKGELTIKINGHIIYEGELSSSGLPITIPITYLNKGQNALTFESNFAFLFSNYYLLESVQLLTTETNANTISSRAFFIENLSSTKKAKLSYYISCNNDKDDMLSVFLNNKRILSDEVFCEYMEPRELLLSVNSLLEENTLAFQIGTDSLPAKGDYNIDEIKLTLTSSKAGYPSYTFELAEDQLDKTIMLSLKFADASSSKKAAIEINGYSISMDTSGSEYNKDVTNYISLGKNLIKIIPENAFEISSLIVYAK